MSEAFPAPPLAIQRTEKGERYEKFINNVRNLLDGKDEVQQRKAVQGNESLAKGLGLGKFKGITPAVVHVDTLLSTFSVMYANDEYIGERLMPVVPVDKRSNKFAIYNKRDRFAAPDDEIGVRSTPNELDAGRASDNYSVKDYGFMNYLDLEVMANEDAPLNEMIDLVESINEAVSMKREIRIANFVQNSANYAGNTAAAATNWNNTGTPGGTIITDILAADAALWGGSNPTKKIGVTTLDNWNKCITNNPQIRGLYTAIKDGLATTKAVANYFGFDDILVGRARTDTANSGQAANYGRIWGTNFFSVIRVAQRPSTRSLQFGSTFRFNGDPITTQWQDPKIGKRGGVYAKVAVSEDHKLVAGDAAFLVSAVYA